MERQSDSQQFKDSLDHYLTTPPDGEPPEYNEGREDYLNLADEMNDPDVGPWNESDWDERAVASAKKYAEENGYSWPPGPGDYDRWYDEQHN